MEILVLLFPFLLLYVLLIRPQQRRLREAQQMAASLQPEDEVVTAGGIHGTVTAVDEGTVWLEIAPDVIVRVLKGAIAQRLSDPVTVPDDEEETGDDTDGDDTPGNHQGQP
jgi:preprotein translocase subunit YajC